MPPSRTATYADREPPSDNDEIGLGGLVAAIWRQRVVVVACFGAAVGLGVAYLIVAPVTYEASSSILLDPRLGKTVGADPSTPGFVTDSSAIDSQVKLLTSQTVLSKVATSLHLDDDPDFSGPKFSFLRLLGLQAPTPSGVDLKALERAITIKRPERTYLVEIQAAASTPDKAAAIANAVAEAYNDDQISARVVAARSDAKFVTQKRDQLQKQINDAEKRVEAYKAANRIVSPDGLRANEQQVADLTRELGTSRGRLSDLKARAEQIASIARSGKLAGMTDALKSTTVERLRSAQTDAERDLAKLSETLGTRHPARIEAEAQVARIHGLIDAELKRLQQGAENDYLTEKRNEAQLVAELDRIKGQATTTSQKLVPLREMEREVNALRLSDERFARVGDTLAQQEGDTPPARIIAAARPPVSPSAPKKALVLAIAGALGLFCGLAAALLREGSNLTPPRRTPTPARRNPAPARTRNYWPDSGAPGESRGDPRAVRAPQRPDAAEDEELPERKRAGARGRLVWP
jgi:succinoglycan biosynthesis transport protein ExoP